MSFSAVSRDLFGHFRLERDQLDSSVLICVDFRSVLSVWLH